MTLRYKIKNCWNWKIQK